MQVQDIFGNLHNLEKEALAAGGQGRVYKTLEGDGVVKIAINNGEEITDENAIEEFLQKVDALIYKPIPRDITLILPQATLKDKAGYVMPFLEGLEPLQVLFKGPSALKKDKSLKIPPFWAKLCKDNEDLQRLFAHYIRTNGARFRLKLLAKLASVLFRLHARGLIYCDLSCANVFFGNKDLENPPICLIDADNVCYMGESICIGTPDYQAPELFEGQRNSIESDIYSFGIVAYWLLTTLHPFKDGAMDDMEGEPHTRPFIESQKDKRNAANIYFSLDNILDDKTKELFYVLFEASKDLSKRSSLILFARALEGDALICLECLTCGMHYKDSLELCPYCDAPKPKRLCAESYFLDGLYARFSATIKEKDFCLSLPTLLFKGMVLDFQAPFLYVRPTALEFEHYEGIFINKKKLDDPKKYLESTDLQQGLEIQCKNFSVRLWIEEGKC
ncbi:protein kinase domain-containing protein [Helicobacter suis]|uniref:protein kinase domain-containing protein n=1 Tax=Helicobacter suis TaxID=104628 RepID=UPI0013D7F332|nr:protein kinase [Helicobacter suis]